MADQTFREYRQFPNDAIFQRLVQCGQKLDRTAFIDSDYKITADHKRFIHDVVQTRKAIYATLPSSSFETTGLLKEQHIFVCVLAPTGYEFVVACLAILSVGGAVVPLGPSILQDEGQNIIQKCGTALLISGSRQLGHASSFAAVSVMPVQIAQDPPTVKPATINPNWVIPDTRPGALIFTSGSTGPPKGVVLPRTCFHPGPLHTQPGETYLAYTPVSWAGGVLPPIRLALEGMEIDFLAQDAATPGEFWERIRRKRVTYLKASPKILWRLQRHLETNLFPSCCDKDDEDEARKIRQEYIDGARHIRSLMVGSWLLSSGSKKFWSELLGRPVQTWYGSTEAGGGISVTPLGSSLDRSIGKPLPGVQLKLSDGDRGEILLKSPRMLLGYLKDEKATRSAIDKDGFYHTGDMAHLEGDEYIYDGRASIDHIRSDGIKIPVLEVEHALLSLDYIAEAYIVPVPDEVNGSQVAAVLKPTFEHDRPRVSLERVRADLASGSRALPVYMLPTVLLILPVGEIFPETKSGKIDKPALQRRYFEDLSRYGSLIEIWGLQGKKDVATAGAGASKPWDWAGMQGQPSAEAYVWE